MLHGGRSKYQVFKNKYNVYMTLYRVTIKILSSAYLKKTDKKHMFSTSLVTIILEATIIFKDWITYYHV